MTDEEYAEAVARERKVSAAMSELFRIQDEQRAKAGLPRSDTICGFVGVSQPPSHGHTMGELSRVRERLTGDHTPEQKFLMMGPGFGAGMGEGLVMAFGLAVLAAGMIGLVIGFLIFR